MSRTTNSEGYRPEPRGLDDHPEEKTTDPYLQHEPTAKCAHNPQAVAQWFQQVREDAQDKDLETQKALHAYQAISSVLNYKFGEEKPIDLHDRPEGSMLAIGHSAAQRIMEYGDSQPDTNERLKDWNQTLTAFAFTVKPEESQPLWQAIREHGHYYSKPVFMPQE